jgi:hypothetical protein
MYYGVDVTVFLKHRADQRAIFYISFVEDSTFSEFSATRHKIVNNYRRDASVDARRRNRAANVSGSSGNEDFHRFDLLHV